MKKLEIIGNLGSDARVETVNGKQFVALSIADTQRVKNPDGTTAEKTEWVSATINGDGGQLLQYLKKGVKVYASGDCQVRMYHSEQQRSLVAGLKLFIRDIELVSTNTDDVPRDLYDVNGRAYRTGKFYHTAETKDCELYNRQGEVFKVDRKGFITRVIPSNTEADNNTNLEQTS